LVLFDSVPDLDTTSAKNILRKFAQDNFLLDSSEERKSRSKSNVSVHEFPIIGGFGMDVKSPHDVPPEIEKRLNDSGLRNDRGGPSKFTVMDPETTVVIESLDKFARQQIIEVFPEMTEVALGYVQFIRVDAGSEVKRHHDPCAYGDIVAVYAIQGEGLVGIEGIGEDFLLKEGQFYVFDHKIDHWVDCKQSTETRLTVTLRYFEIGISRAILKNQSIDNFFLENGYTTWDLELSFGDMEIMSNFCSCFTGGDHRELLGSRKAISVPLAELPECSQRIFTPKLFDVLSHYFGYEPAIIEAVIVKVQSGLEAQLIHPDTSLGYGLSANLAIQFDSYLTTWLIPGSHTPERKKDLKCTDDSIDCEMAKPLQYQPCISERKNAMLYDSSILHFGGGNTSSNCNSSRIFFTFGAILPVSVMKEITPKYHAPEDPMINKLVLEKINKDMLQSSLRYKFKEFYDGKVVSFDEFALFNESNIAFVGDVKRVIVENVFLIHTNDGNFTLKEMDILAKLVMMIVRGDNVKPKRREIKEYDSWIKLFEQGTDEKISNFAQKVKQYYSADSANNKEVVFSGTAIKKKEMLTELSQIYSTFNQYRIREVNHKVVSFVKDYLYETFSDTFSDWKNWKNKLSEIEDKIEAQVTIINVHKEYEYESPDFHMSWGDDAIRDYIGSIIFTSASVDQRRKRLERLVEHFKDDKVPAIKRMFYQKFSSLGNRDISEKLEEIFQESIAVFESSTSLYTDVVIPEDLLLSWKSMPILKIMERIATSKSKKKSTTDFETLENYFDLYVSYAAVPYLQEFLFRYFTEKKKQQTLNAVDVQLIQETFVSTRARSIEMNQIEKSEEVTDEVLDLLKSKLLFNMVHTFAFEEDTRNLSKQKKLLQTSFTSFKKVFQNISEPSEKVLFIKESKKSSEKIIDLTKKTLRQIDGCDNFNFIKEKLNKLIKAFAKEEKEHVKIVEVLKVKVETIRNKKVNFL